VFSYFRRSKWNTSKTAEEINEMRPSNAVIGAVFLALRWTMLVCFVSMAGAAVIVPSTSGADGFNMIRYEIDVTSQAPMTSKAAAASKSDGIGSRRDVRMQAIVDEENGSRTLFAAFRNTIYGFRIGRDDLLDAGTAATFRDAGSVYSGDDRRRSRRPELFYVTGPVVASNGNWTVACDNILPGSGGKTAVGALCNSSKGSFDVEPVLLMAVPHIGRRLASDGDRSQLVFYCDKTTTTTTTRRKNSDVVTGGDRNDDVRCLLFNSSTSSPLSGYLRSVGRLVGEASVAALMRAVGGIGSSTVRAFVGTSFSAADGNETTFPLYVASGGPRPNSSVLATLSSLRLTFRRASNAGSINGAFDAEISTRGRIELSARPTWSVGRFPVRYVAGGQFEYGRFVYFVAVQPDTVPIAAAEPTLVTKLVRFCRDDDSLSSYVELILTCDGGRLSPTSVATAAVLVRRKSIVRDGHRSSPTDGEMDDDDRLLVLFDSPQSATDRREDAGDVDAILSAVCVYRMSDVRKEITKGIRECYRGIGSLLPWTHSTDASCKSDVSAADLFMNSLSEESCAQAVR
jgi:hypothetical protein